MRLLPGTDLRKGIEALAGSLPDASGFVVGGIGSLAHARLRMAGEIEERLLPGPLEIVSIAGTISLDGTHLHMSVSNARGDVVGGHVCAGCEIRTTAEILVVELPGHKLGREFDAATGYKELVVTRAKSRPPFIRSASEIPGRAHVYPQSTESMGPVRRLGKEAGLERIGINIQRLPPGTRSSWPHAEENEEEFVFVLDGAVDAWIDGHLHKMHPGDLAAFPVGTGISHCFINNTDTEVVLLVGGEAPRQGSRIYYPRNPSRRQDMKPENWWDDVPQRELGPHDGLPDKLRHSLINAGDK